MNQNPFILLMVGAIGSGKDTVADWLVENLAFDKLGFADPLKEMAAALFNFPAHWCYERKGKEKKPPLGGGKTVGQILQLLGTEGVRAINPDFWAQRMEQRIQSLGCPRVVITDCRFKNEALYFIHRYPNAFLYHLTRRDESLRGERYPTHASEDMDWVNDLSSPLFQRLMVIYNHSMSLEETKAFVLEQTPILWGGPRYELDSNLQRQEV